MQAIRVHEGGALVRVESIEAPERVGTVTGAVPDSEILAGSGIASDLAPTAELDEITATIQRQNSKAPIYHSAATHTARRTWERSAYPMAPKPIVMVAKSDGGTSSSYGS